MPEDVFWLITLYCIQRYSHETSTCNLSLKLLSLHSIRWFNREEITVIIFLAFSASSMLKQILLRFCDNPRPRSCFALFTLNRSHFLEKASDLDFKATWCCEPVGADYL